MNELIKRIVDFIIEDVKESTTDFQSVCFYEDIQEKFAMEIEQTIFSMVEDELNTKEEVADVIQDTDGFDVVLYTDYSPNYNSDDYIQE